jgi:hypothetical protein
MKASFAPPVLLILHLVQIIDAFSPIVSHIRPCSVTKQLCPHILRARRSEEEEYSEDSDDEFYDTRQVGGSPEERELRRMKYEDDEDFRDDEQDNEIAYYGNDYDDEEYEDLDEEDIDDRPETGNFWANPRERMDSAPDVVRPTRRQRPMPPSTAQPRRRPASSPGARTTFRSGTPAPPGAMKDLYDRIFWFGIEEEDGDWVPKSYDKTVFGGTRGKFNALSYLEDGYDARPPPRRIKRRLPPEDGDEDDEISMDDNYDEDYGDDDDIPRREAPRGRRGRDPSFDFDERSSNRQRQNRRGNDRVSGEASSWFVEDDAPDYVDQDDFEEERRRPSRQGRQKKSNGNPIVNFLDGLLDMDREDMEARAELYEQNVGRRPKPQERAPRRRPGNAYRFDDDDFNDADDEDDDIVVDVEIEEETDAQQEEEATPTKPRMSREERSRRLDRVPPAGVAAWGPSGDLGIDARTQAMLDGLEELRAARAQLALKTERAKLARDEIVILRADAALEQKKGQADQRRARDRLRYIQLEIEDAARDLRRAQKAEQQAREQLEALQDKHWAVLSIYDANTASREIDNAFSELSQQEPAAGIETPEVAAYAPNVPLQEPASVEEPNEEDR